MNTLEKRMHYWLESINTEDKNISEIIAFHFGLFETESSYTMYIIGSKIYDSDDGSWIEEEDFIPENKYFNTEVQSESVGWSEFQNTIIRILTQYIHSESFKSSFLVNARHITIGFDDGDLEIIV